MHVSRYVRGLAAATALLVGASGAAVAGPVFLTGHDPDFHAPTSVGAQNLLTAGLDFVTGNTTFSNTEKFLWVESRISPPSGHRVGENALGAIGLTLGTHYDRANAAELAAVDFSNYTAIAVASSFGALLGRAELDALIARKADIETHINAGGGLMALAECDGTFGSCGDNLLGANADLFGFVPLSGIVPEAVTQSFTVTADGAAAPFNLTVADVSDPTHNAFDPAQVPAALKILDFDSNNNAVTLAGNVRIQGGGFVGDVPEPATLGLLGAGIIGLGVLRRRRRNRTV